MRNQSRAGIVLVGLFLGLSLIACDAAGGEDAGAGPSPDVATDGGGEPDGGEPDAPADAGEPDAPADGGEPSVATDAGEPDAPVDGGEPDVTPEPFDGGPDGPCPAPAPGGGAFAVFDDAIAPQWEMYGFAGALIDSTETVCSGSNAVGYSSGQYDGLAFETPDANAFTAGRLSVRVHLDRATYWAVAAVEPGETDPHQFIGEGTWEAGWQHLEFDIPESTASTRWILFEKQDVGQDTIILDDIRLLPR